MTKQTFTITNSAGLKLKGELVNYVAGRPVVVLVHGFGGFMREPQFLFLKKYLIWHRYAVCSFDFTNGLGSSQRDATKISYGLFGEDLRSVFVWLADRGISTVSVIAHSMGGALIAEYLTSANKPMKISSAVFIAPFIRWHRPIEELDRKHRVLVKGGEKFFVLRRWLKKLEVPYSYFQRMQNHDIYDCAAPLQAPVLFILGKLDKTTPAEFAKEFASRMTAEHKVLEYDGLGHTFFYKSAVKLLPEIAFEIYQWIQAHE